VRPQLRPVEGDGHERHASWLELFFDLIFVMVISQLARLLYDSTTLEGFLRFAALFIPLWWSWVGYVFYASRFEVERDITYRFMMMAAMLFVGALAVNIRGAFASDSGARAFAISYIGVRIVLIALYGRAWWHVHLARMLATHYITGFAIGCAFWIASIFVGPPARYVLWGIGLLVELTTPLFSGRAIARTPYDPSHIPERFGLFTIIVLGEAILAAVTGLADSHWIGRSTLEAAMGFGIAAAVWWIYFDFVETCVVRFWGRSGQVYTYGHFTIAMSIVMMGVGTHHAILDSLSHDLPSSTRWLLCGGAALYLASITVIRLSSGYTDLVPSRILFAVASLGLAAFGGTLDPLLFLGLMLLFLVAEIAIESRSGPVALLHDKERPGAEPEGTPMPGDVFRVAMSKGCTHLDQARDVTPSANGCEECLALGETWVQARICLICGHVGCCETSKNRHAWKHYQETGHPLIESFEPGNKWRWCYIDETYL
jgi:low temperature requirement protein LtrA